MRLLDAALIVRARLLREGQHVVQAVDRYDARARADPAARDIVALADVRGVVHGQLRAARRDRGLRVAGGVRDAARLLDGRHRRLHPHAR